MPKNTPSARARRERRAEDHEIQRRAAKAASKRQDARRQTNIGAIRKVTLATIPHLVAYEESWDCPVMPVSEILRYEVLHRLAEPHGLAVHAIVTLRGHGAATWAMPLDQLHFATVDQLHFTA